jgi:hypothetical protein
MNLFAKVGRKGDRQTENIGLLAPMAAMENGPG